MKNLRSNVFNNVILTSSQVIFPILTFPYITRVLSNESLGSIIYVDAFTQYFIIISSLGIPLYGVREIAKVNSDKILRSKLVIELIVIKLILSIILASILLLLYFFTSIFKDSLSLIKLACLGIISSTFYIEWFYQGIQDFRFITKRSLIIKILSVVAIFLFVNNYNDNVIYYAILISVSLVNSLINFGYYLNKHHQKFSNDLEFKKHLNPLLILFSINIAVSVYNVFDTIILGLLTNYIDVSYYNVGLRICKIFTTITLSIGFVLIPKISKIYNDKDFNALKALISKSMSVIFILSIPFCFFNLIYAEELIVLLAGNNYENAANALRIFSFNPLIIGLCNVLGTQFLLPIGKEKKILKAAILGLITSIILNFSLIPIIGFIGASIASVLAEVCVCLYIYYSTKQEIKISIDFQIVKLISISLLFTTIFILLFKNQVSDIYEVLISLIAYSLIFLVLQLFYFRNTFINSILNYISKKSNE